MVTIYRMFESQPYLRQVWNCSGLFNDILDNHFRTATDNFILQSLRLQVAPSNKALSQLTASLRTIENLEYMDSLRLNKKEEAEKQRHLETLFGTVKITRAASTKSEKHHSKKGKVMTSYLKERVDSVLEEMEEGIFRHFAISGDEGSGKMSFIELLADSFHAN